MTRTGESKHDYSIDPIQYVTMSIIKGSPIPPGTTTAADVVWAYRVILARELTDEHVIDRIRLANQSLSTLHVRLVRSPGFTQDQRRQRAARTSLDATYVRWAYRLLRFEVIDYEAARRVAARHGTLLSLVDVLLEAPDYVSCLERVARREAEGVTRVYVKSMPRSGHHLLVNMLCEYFGAAIHYCEFYRGLPSCCHAIPCRQPFDPLLQNDFFMQKSHDFQDDDPVNLPGKYIIQYRHPVPRMQSNFDHYVHVNDKEDSAAHFRRFARGDMRYYVRFWKKWMKDPQPNFFLVSYEALVGIPRETFVRLLHFLDDDHVINEDALQCALSLMRVPSGSSMQQTSVFTRRKVEAYRYYDEALYRTIEYEVFSQCPGLPYERMFLK